MLPENFEELTFTFTLRDGAKILVRRITQDDKKRIEEGFKKFSPRSRYLRFFSQIRRLTKTQLAYLTEIDYETHMAWGAVLRDDEDSGVGVARYVRLPKELNTAEIAISVIDPMHGQGIGTILLAALSLSAQKRGITSFRSYILKENKQLMDSIRNLYGALSYKEKGVFEIDTPVFSLKENNFPDTSTGRILKQTMEEFVVQAGG